MISSNIYGYKAHDRMEQKPEYPENNRIERLNRYSVLNYMGYGDIHPMSNLEDCG